MLIQNVTFLIRIIHFHCRYGTHNQRIGIENKHSRSESGMVCGIFYITKTLLSSSWLRANNSNNSGPIFSLFKYFYDLNAEVWKYFYIFAKKKIASKNMIYEVYLWFENDSWVEKTNAAKRESETSFIIHRHPNYVHCTTFQNWKNERNEFDLKCVKLTEYRFFSSVARGMEHSNMSRHVIGDSICVQHEFEFHSIPSTTKKKI